MNTCTCSQKPNFPALVRAEVGGLTRVISFRPGHVCTRTGPGRHGRRGTDLLFMLIGPELAVEFIVYTGWYPDWDQGAKKTVLPALLGYHSPTPRYEGQEPLTVSCEFLGGRPCYTDGSTLAAADVFKLFVQFGEEALWRRLTEYYKETLDAD